MGRNSKRQSLHKQCRVFKEAKPINPGDGKKQGFTFCSGEVPSSGKQLLAALQPPRERQCPLLFLSFQHPVETVQLHRQRCCSSTWPPRFLFVGSMKGHSERWKVVPSSLWESVTRLMTCSVWWPSCRRRWQTEENSITCQREIGQWSCTLPSLMNGSQFSVVTMEKGPGSALCQEKGSLTRSQERQKKATAQGRKEKLSLPSKVLLQNRFELLGTLDEAHEVEEEPVKEILTRSETPTKGLPTKLATNQLPEETAVSYGHGWFSLLWNRSTHLQTSSFADPLFREICYLPGPQIKCFITRLKSLSQTSDYYSFLLFHTSTNDGAEGGTHLVDKAFLHFNDKLILQLVIVY